MIFLSVGITHLRVILMLKSSRMKRMCNLLHTAFFNRIASHITAVISS